MNSNQIENIEYKDINYNYSKNILPDSKEQISPNIYFYKKKKPPRIIYSKKNGSIKNDSINSTSSQKFYRNTQNGFYSPSQPYLEEIAKIKKAKFLENELKKLRMNYISLNNDNIILREDINQLFENNKRLEQELSQERSNNYELAKENDILSNENQNLFNKIDEANQKIDKIKNNYPKENEIMNKQIYFEEKIKEKDLTCKEIIEENNKLNYEYNFLNDKFSLLKEKNNKDEIELNNLKQIQEQNLNSIENKLAILLNEMEKLKYENNELKKENENLKISITNSEKEKNDYYNNYQELKMKNEMINKEIQEIKEKYQDYKIQLENKIQNDNKKEKIKKNKSENKINVIKDLHKKIQQYKKERNKQRISNKIDDD